MAEEKSRSLEARLWCNTGIVTLLTFVFFLVYVGFLDRSFSLASLSKCIAGTSGLLLAYSLSLSTFGYYFDLLDTKIIYRKYLGLVGYFFALMYSFLLLILDPERYWYGFFENFWSADFVLGFSAMGILTVMALVSNNGALHILGAKKWRAILRLGYLAFFLLVLRAVILEGDMWHTWVVSGSGLPPVRLFLSCIAIGVIFFRLSVFFALSSKEKKSVL